MSPTIRVLIADDSPTMLKMYSALLASAPDIEVVGTAKDGAEALELARTLHPDVITLDVRMPRMDGIEASSRIMSEAPSRILVISGAVDAEMSFKALQAGALEVLPKPRPGLEGLANFGVKLVHIIRSMAELPLSERRPPVAPSARPTASPQGGRVSGFGLVASTGGPPALCLLLSLLPPKLPYPIFIAQHVSDGFTAGLCQWLGAASSLRLEVAQTGVKPQPGFVYLPPDGHQLQVALLGELLVEPIQAKASLGDTLLASLALAYGNRAAGAVLTGMGSDGAAGLLAIRRAGGLTFAQSPESCVVPGMPEAAQRLGATDMMLSLEALASAMRSLSGVAPPAPSVKN